MGEDSSSKYPQNQQTTDFQTSARLCPVLISLLWHLSTWFAVFPYHPSFATFRESAAFNTAWSRLRTEAFCFLGKLVEHVKQLRQIAGSASASSSNDHHGDIRGLLAAYKVVHETLLTLHPGNLHSNYTAVVNMVDGQVHRACQKVVQQVGGDMHPAATAEQLRFSNTRQSGAPDKVGKPYYSLHGWAGPRYIQPPMQQGKPWDNQFLHRMDPSRHDPATTGMIPDQHAWKIMHTSQVGSQSVASGAVVPERGVGNVRAARADIETPAEYSSLRLHGGFGHAAGASQICFVSTFDQLAQASGYDDADDSRLTDDARAHIQNEADEWDRRERAMELAGMGHR
jgi:hypothetical protein